MKLSFWAIGKNNDPYVRTGVEEFTGRINNYFKVDWNILPVPKNAGMLSEMDLKRKEGETLLEWLGKDDYVVALDERGKQLSSKKLAEFIQARANDSTKRLIFVIGGAFGLDDA